MIISDEQELYYPATIAQYRADWFSDTGLLPGSKKGASKPDAVARERLPRQENEPVVRDCSLEMIGCEAKLGFPCKHYSGPYLRGSVDLWYTTGFDLDEHLAAAACRLLGVKPESGVPVLCLIRNRRHQIVERYVKVLRAERCRVPASQILVPRAYRLARDQAELLFADGAGNPDLERLFQVSPVSSSKTSSSRPRQKDPGSGNSGSSKPNFKVHPSSKVTNSNNPG